MHAPREPHEYARHYVDSNEGDALTRIAAAIRSRYELTEQEE